MKKDISGRGGFTLIELVIVIVIIGILAGVGVPIYRSYARKAIITEGKSLIDALSRAQDAYIAEKGVYCSAAGPVPELFPAPAENKYFRTYTCTNVSGSLSDGNARVTITVPGAAGSDAEGIVVTGEKRYNQPFEVEVAGE